MSLLIPSSVQTMSSLEIAKLTGKEHKHILADIRTMLDALKIDSAEFSAQYKDSSGKQNPCFDLPKRECLILVSGYSIELRAKIIDRWTELETKQTTQPYSLEDQVKAAAVFVSLITSELNLPESGKLSVMGKLADAYGLPKQLLPSYGIDAPPESIVTTGSSVPTMSLTTILKPYALSAKAANQILIGLGIVEERSRPSTKTGTKTFKALTAKGLQYGKNITSPSNPREVQIHWYEDKVGALLKVLGVV